MSPPSHVSGIAADDRRRLVVAAASIEQLTLWLESAQVHPGGQGSADEAAAAYRSWSRAFSPHDAPAFERRLAWDGLTREQALEVLSPGLLPGPSFELPPWVGWLDRILAETERVAHALERVGHRAGDRFDSADLPFVELLRPMVAAGMAVLRARVPAPALEGVMPDVVVSLELQIAHELSRVAELALYETFRNHLTDRMLEAPAVDVGPDEQYERWIDAMYAGGLARFFCDYPVLTRQVATLLDGWCAATGELLVRLETDRAALQTRLAQGRPLGRVAAIEPALSDPHAGRRRVAWLQFESGVEVVYKPRSIELEAVFSDFLRWCADRGLQPAHKAMAVLSRAGYGWVEHVKAEALPDARAAHRYHWQFGSLLALAHLLRGRDLHMENLIASSDGPVLIDLELFFEPESGQADDKSDAGCQVQDTCLSTGLVSFVDGDGDGPLFDVGALRGTGQGTAALSQRRWKDLGSASMHFVEERQFQTRAANRPTIDGIPVAPEPFAGAILAGFTDTYRFLLDQRDALLEDDGPLMSFAGLATRVIPRATNQYGLLLHVLNQPKYQRRGVARSAAIDVLHRIFAGAGGERPAVWDVVRVEREVLDGMDVPHFTVSTDDVTVYANGHPILAGHFSRAGLPAVLDRLRHLSEADLEIQLAAIERALAQSVETRYGRPLDDVPIPASDRNTLAEYASWIGYELLESAKQDGGGLSWDRTPSRERDRTSLRLHHLYDGSLGAPLLFSALYATTGEVVWHDAARASLSRVLDGLEQAVLDPDEPLGGCSGLASIVHGLTAIGSLLEEPAAFEAARRWRRQITRERIEHDTFFDVVAGSAGCILGLLASGPALDDDGALVLAEESGRHLLASAVRMETGWAWPAADGRCYVGYAHGAAGIAVALARLAHASGNAEFADAARNALRYVEHHRSEIRANWDVASAPTRAAVPAAAMTAWCHGAPGVALALSAASACGAATDVDDRIAIALKTTATAAPHRAEHLCCGNLGRAEALLTVGRAQTLPDAIAAAERLAAQACGRAQRRGHFRLSASPFEYTIFDPSFFRGISGIGYQLLRMRAPDVLPSIAAFETIR